MRIDIAPGMQPPDVTAALMPRVQPIMDRLPAGYRITPAGSVEESGKADRALAPLFPVMVALMLTVIMLQPRSF